MLNKSSKTIISYALSFFLSFAITKGYIASYDSPKSSVANVEDSDNSLSIMNNSNKSSLVYSGFPDIIKDFQDSVLSHRKVISDKSLALNMPKAFKGSHVGNRASLDRILTNALPSHYDKADSIDNALFQNDSISTAQDFINETALQNTISYYSSIDKGVFVDNEFYALVRQSNAEAVISQYMAGSENIIVIDKTFQKAMLYTKAFDNMQKGSLNRDRYILFREVDCSTAKAYGKKIRDGDGKTPEGLFYLDTAVPSHNKLYEGKKAYGPYFMRLYHSIGLHGNGTDTLSVKEWDDDTAFMPPDPLGITASNNFGYGVSHGCIRLDNSVVRELVESRFLRKGVAIIIYENKGISSMLRLAYNNHKHINDILANRQ